MTVDFRCEKCGKLLSVDATEGSSVRCPHCNKKVHIPAGLAALPRPQAPPGTPTTTAPSAPGEASGQEPEAITNGQADPTMVLIAMLMPWVLSVFLHIGVGLIMLFFVLFTTGTLPTNVTRPSNPDPEDVPDMVDVGERPSLDESTRQTRRKSAISDRESAIQADAGKTDKQIAIFAVGGGGSDPFDGGSQLGGGDLFGSKPRGNVYHVVYVIDRSGSMVTRFDEVKIEMVQSISSLSKAQDFHVILFAQDKAIENPPRRLVYADQAHKLGVVKFLEGVTPAGKTTALPALKRAFEVLKTADSARKGQVIYLLTDGQFSGIGGGSRYKGESGDKAVIEWLRDNNSSKKVHVMTLLYGQDPDAIEVMKQIARENGGRFKSIGED